MEKEMSESNGEFSYFSGFIERGAGGFCMKESLPEARAYKATGLNGDRDPMERLSGFTIG
jgi:hypothetical protein